MKQLTHSYDEVYVISGPLYLPQRTPQGFQMQHAMIGATLWTAPSRGHVCLSTESMAFLPAP